ncbi:hypothetical protein GL982_07145 [Spiroplasma citri]|uniref:hypothetical protein n=1 Tax=Spiroplasma citri TaxID=2133 RepID=UPI0013A088E5|nr:hypothetical protein [Spiroplasma citri]QIA73194.1 hypothetical protein GL982_05980 [Spiroplasma citri]QIA73394.1 hypothetical protein GL982_07145 [Spiroplasma citri]
MENNLNNLLFITVEDVKESKLWQPINDRKQSAYNDNLIYNAILKTSLWMDRLTGGTISDKINKKDLFPWVKKDNTGVIEYDKWLSYIQSACLLAVINWYLPKGVNDLTGSASFSQGGVAYSQTNDPEANENITRDVKNALKLAGEIIDIISSKTNIRPYNYNLGNYAHPWEEEYKYITKKTFYETLLFWLKERFQTDNSINITYPTINDFSKIDYNEYIKLIVPFDNDTIYYENNVWKAKQGGDIPSDVIKDSDLNKDYIDKEDGKYIVKKAQSGSSITVNAPLHQKDDSSLELLLSNDFDIENNKLSLNKGLKDNIEQILKWVLEMDKKIIWEEVPISSFKPDVNNYIDIPEFSEKYCYDVRISPTNFKEAEGFLWLRPPYFTKQANKTLIKQQSNCFAGDVGKIPYDLSLYSAIGRVYLTDVSTGANTKINSVRIFRKEV